MGFRRLDALRVRLSRYLENLADPLITTSLLHTQKPTVLFRVDGRSPEELQKSGGLPAVATEAQLEAVRKSRVEEYQHANKSPFGYGACSTLANLLGFCKGNATNHQWIYTFSGPASSLHAVKVHAGIDTHAYDAEKEHLVLKAIPFADFYVGIAPDDRKQFLANKPVANGMRKYNSDLPETVRKQDLDTPENFLTWLKSGKDEKVFTAVCKYLFKDAKKDDYKELKSPQLVAAIEKVLTPVVQQPAPKPQATSTHTQGMGTAAQMVTNQLAMAQMKDTLKQMHQGTEQAPDTSPGMSKK